MSVILPYGLGTGSFKGILLDKGQTNVKKDGNIWELTLQSLLLLN